MDFVNQYMPIPVMIATLAILAALIVTILVWRTFNLKVRGRRGQRLGISEYHELDKTRRLVLVRRDNTEHLILIGGPQDVVIEQGIGIPGSQSLVPREEETLQPVSLRAAPRPPVFGDRRAPLRTVEREEPQLADVRSLEPEVI
jgi:hypothetical protein